MATPASNSHAGSDPNDPPTAVGGIRKTRHEFRCRCYPNDPPTAVGGIRAAPNNTVIQTAFSFEGLLQVCPTSCLINPPLFTVELVGSGVADLALQFAGFSSQGAQIYTFQNINYSFRNEIPEPVSLVLLSSGLAALGLKLRRARTK